MGWGQSYVGSVAKSCDFTVIVMLSSIFIKPQLQVTWFDENLSFHFKRKSKFVALIVARKS